MKARNKKAGVTFNHFPVNEGTIIFLQRIENHNQNNKDATIYLKLLDRST